MQSKLIIPQQNSISLLILLRSLYILKSKFSSYNTIINKIYSKYTLPFTSFSNNIKIIKTATFPFIIQELLFATKTFISKILSPPELFILKFIDSSFYKEQNRKVSSLIYDFLIIPSNLAKYKEKYYTLKIYPQIINNNIPEQSINDLNELMKQKEYFYVEMIPMVIADYIQYQSNNMFVFINIDDNDKELNESVKEKYDNEIWKKILEMNNNTSNNNNNNSKHNKEIEIHKEENDISSSITPSLSVFSHNTNNTINNNQEQKQFNKAIRIIFNFYSSKKKGHFSSFQELREKQSKLFISEFGNFCTDFNLNLSSFKITEIFKRHSSHSQYITQNEFVSALKYISIFKHKQQLEILVSKYANTNDIQSQIENIKHKTSIQVFKEFITNVIGIDTNNTYRTKMKGYVDNSINKSKGFKPVKEDYIYNYRANQLALRRAEEEKEERARKEKELLNKQLMKLKEEKEKEKEWDFDWSRIENFNIENLKLNDKEKEIFDNVECNLNNNNNSTNNNKEDDFELFKNMHLHQIQNESNLTIEGCKQLFSCNSNSNLSEILQHNDNTNNSNNVEISLPTIQCKQITDKYDTLINDNNSSSNINNKRNLVLPEIKTNNSFVNVYSAKHSYNRYNSNSNGKDLSVRVESLSGIGKSLISPINRSVSGVGKYNGITLENKQRNMNRNIRNKMGNRLLKIQ
jgi:hypothetical protein